MRLYNSISSKIGKNFFKNMVILIAILAAYIFPSISYSAGLGWDVNVWGNPLPLYTSKVPNESFCTRNGIPSQYFKILEKKKGGAEISIPGVLKPGKAYSFKVYLRNEYTSNVEIFFRRDTALYETSAIRTISVTSEWTLAELKGIYTSPTKGSIRIAIKTAGAGLCLNSASLTEISYNDIGSTTKQSPVDAQFFGVHINKLGVHYEWPSFNPGTVRLWDTGTTWSVLKPNSGPINWDENINAKRLDLYISHVRKYNPSTTLIYTLAMTPTWAGTSHPTNCNNLYYGPRGCTKPVNLDHWRLFVRELAVRYKGVIKVWEIWNEADIWYQWNGTNKDMFDMVRIAYEELKDADPSNIVIGPNITSLGMRFLNEFLARGGGKYVDGLSIHGYLGRAPEKALSVIRNMREMVKSYNLNLPIWNTETGVPCNSVFEQCNVLTFKDEDYLNGDISLGIGLIGNAALGVLNFSYYTWEGAAVDIGGLPLVQDDFKKPTSTSLVFSRVSSWLEGGEVQYDARSTDELNIVSINKNGEKAYVLWSKGIWVDVPLSQFTETLSNKWYLRQSSPDDINTSSIKVGIEPILIYASQFPFSNKHLSPIQ